MNVRKYQLEKPETTDECLSLGDLKNWGVAKNEQKLKHLESCKLCKTALEGYLFSQDKKQSKARYTPKS